MRKLGCIIYNLFEIKEHLMYQDMNKQNEYVRKR